MRGVAFFAALGLFADAAAPAAPPSTAIPAGSHYVAMGSSFAAGPGIGAIKPGTPERCARAVNNYASELAKALSLDLDDASCSGATTRDLLDDSKDLPAQLDAVTPETQLVTITVGGNDLNYMGLLFTASCDASAEKCAPRVHMPPEEAYGHLRDNLVLIVRRIRETAPEAKVVFVQYVSLVPGTPCDQTPIDAVAQGEARDLAARLAQITREAASESGAQVLPVEALSANHTACDPQPWSRGFQHGGAAAGIVPWHPNAEGHSAIAAALVQLLSRPRP